MRKNINPSKGSRRPLEGFSEGAADAVLSFTGVNLLKVLACKRAIPIAIQALRFFSQFISSELTHYGHRSIPSTILIYSWRKNCQVAQGPLRQGASEACFPFDIFWEINRKASVVRLERKQVAHGANPCPGGKPCAPGAEQEVGRKQTTICICMAVPRRGENRFHA